MIDFSEEYRHAASQLLTFSGVAFSLKVIPLQAITISDVNITLESRPVAIGLIAFFVLYLLLNYAVIALRDVGRQRLRDRDAFQRDADSAKSVDLTAPSSPASAVSDWTLFLGQLHVGLESILPALFSVFVIVLCRSELLIFFSHVWAVATEGLPFRHV